jgi:hypothetical protein
LIVVTDVDGKLAAPDSWWSRLANELSAYMPDHVSEFPQSLRAYLLAARALIAENGYMINLSFAQRGLEICLTFKHIMMFSSRA